MNSQHASLTKQDMMIQ